MDALPTLRKTPPAYSLSPSEMKALLKHTQVSCIFPYASVRDVCRRAHLGDVKQNPFFFQVVGGGIINFTGGKI